MSLVPLPTSLCPECGADLDHLTVEQPALIRHGGYGATAQSRLRTCPACAFVFHAEQNEVRP